MGVGFHTDAVLSLMWKSATTRDTWPGGRAGAFPSPGICFCLAAAGNVIDGVELYQLTKNGLALQATLQGTKYWKDRDLND
ncbi:MAG: hypothetical protein KA788_13060 [Lacunisphaera sp.]|nr:hypothetical protein [Lacunisphaera sp.]